MPVVVDLVAGQLHDAGDVEITTVEGGLRIDVAMHGAWRLELVHMYAGLGLPPNNGSMMSPGQFPYAEVLESADAFTLEIPLAALEGVGCGDALLVAVHADVVGDLEGEAVCETAWAAGPYGIGAAWGTYLDATLCCE